MKDLLGKRGARLKEIRKTRRLTQERLAEPAGLSPRDLSRLEVGQQSASIETLARLAQALAVELWELFTCGHVCTAKELQEPLHKLVREVNEEKLRLVVTVVRALAR